MNIVILTSAHPIDDVRVMTKIAGGFAELGHDVSWFGPDHSFFGGTRDTRINWHLTHHRPGYRGRLMALIRSARSAASIEDADWIYTPDPDAALVALWASRVSRSRTIFDIHEEFHNGLLRRGVKQPLLVCILSRLVKAAISWITRRSDLTIAVSDTILDTYTKTGQARLTALNTAPLDFSLESSAPAPRHSGMRVMHGKALPGNGTPRVVQAIRLLPPDCDLRLVFITRASANTEPFDPAIEQALQSADVAPHVEIVPGIPHTEMPRLLASCSIGVISYGRLLGQASLPNRLFEYMAAGIAVIAPSYSPEIVRILDRHKCGLTADFEDPNDICEKLSRLAQDPEAATAMGARGRQAFVEHYAWEAQIKRVEARMHDVQLGGRA